MDWKRACPTVERRNHADSSGRTSTVRCPVGADAVTAPVAAPRVSSADGTSGVAATAAAPRSATVATVAARRVDARAVASGRSAVASAGGADRGAAAREWVVACGGPAAVGVAGRVVASTAGYTGGRVAPVGGVYAVPPVMVATWATAAAATATADVTPVAGGWGRSVSADSTTSDSAPGARSTSESTSVAVAPGMSGAPVCWRKEINRRLNAVNKARLGATITDSKIRSIARCFLHDMQQCLVFATVILFLRFGEDITSKYRCEMSAVM